jgi:hypothetical protein
MNRNTNILFRLARRAGLVSLLVTSLAAGTVVPMVSLADMTGCAARIRQMGDSCQLISYVFGNDGGFPVAALAFQCLAGGYYGSADELERAIAAAQVYYIAVPSKE